MNYGQKISSRTQQELSDDCPIITTSIVSSDFPQKKITTRRISKNKRNEKLDNREKFGIMIPNSVKEALIMDRQANNTLWTNAISKEMAALEKAKCFKYYPPNHKVPNNFQYAPLRMIFDVKQENLRRKARLVAGGHVVNSNLYKSYSSVI